MSEKPTDLETSEVGRKKRCYIPAQQAMALRSNRAEFYAQAYNTTPTRTDQTNYMKNRQRMSKGERIRSDFNIAMNNQITSPFGGRQGSGAFEQTSSNFGNTQINFANYASQTGGPFLQD
jgi:hypothetical protein